MVVGFILHDALHWQPWFVAALGMTVLVFASRDLLMDHAMEHVEVPLLIFFMGLFMVVGGVEHSEFLVYVGQFILPFAQNDLLTATIVLMWVSAVLSAAIDNIPFTAAMIPIILGMETQGINVTPIWWGLALGVGLGGNGTPHRFDGQRLHRYDLRALGAPGKRPELGDHAGHVVQEGLRRRCS